MTDRDVKDLSGAAKMNRRGLLKCMAWTGTGVVWTLSGGVPRTLGLIGGAAAAEAPQGALTFVQISDSHIGFHLPPNPDPSATLTEAIEKIKAMPTQPAFLVHTGDISHLSKEEQWDDADQIIKSANKQVFFLPGEHDVAATVDIDNFAFTPAALTVTAGTTVTWKNEDDSPHRIGDKNGTFKSAALDTDDTFSHTFTVPGEYAYICTIHPYMAGTIIVKSDKPAS